MLGFMTDVYPLRFKGFFFQLEIVGVYFPNSVDCSWNNLFQMFQRYPSNNFDSIS